MAKDDIYISESKLQEIIEEYVTGYSIKEMLNDIFENSDDLIHCEDCHFSKPCYTPQMNEQHCMCEYEHEGVYVMREHFCSKGIRRKAL